MLPLPVPAFNPHLAALSCFACGRRHGHRVPATVCHSCGLPLRADYVLDRDTMPRAALSRREHTMWRYREVLPIASGEVSLAEGGTPLVRLDDRLWIKDESRNPTASFKARGMSAAVSVARAVGARALCAPSAGNAAGALAAYGAAAGLPVTVAMPEDTPPPFVEECRVYGAEVHLVPGTIADAGRWLRDNAPPLAVDLSTLREPFRVEGKKTMAFELFEQFDGLPDVIVYPTGGGTGLVGMWKAFGEMRALGWIDARAPSPRLVSVQAEGCAPVVRAFAAGLDRTEPWTNPRTQAYGLRVPAPIGGFLCLQALRETGGTACSVPEARIGPAARTLAALTGVDICPETGAAWVGLEELRASNWIRSSDRVVLFNTGSGQKYR